MDGLRPEYDDAETLTTTLDMMKLLRERMATLVQFASTAESRMMIAASALAEEAERPVAYYSGSE